MQFHHAAWFYSIVISGGINHQVCVFVIVVLCVCRQVLYLIMKWTTDQIRRGGGGVGWTLFLFYSAKLEKHIFLDVHKPHGKLAHSILLSCRCSVRELHSLHDTDSCYRSQQCIVCESSTHSSWMWNFTPVTDSDSSVSDQKRRRLNVAEHACSCFLSLLSFFIKPPFTELQHWCNTAQYGSCMSSIAWLVRLQHIKAT